MVENQYILELQGLMDRAAAERLLERIDELWEAGETRLVLNCQEVTGAHFEALDFLISELPARTQSQAKPGSHPEKAQIDLAHIPENLARILILLGISVRARSARIGAQTATARNSEAGAGGFPAEQAAVYCENCERPVRVGGTGNFACPHCQAHFYVDKTGHLSFYEPLL